ncbi:short-chain fatty acyl-CoA regulator family protein [Sulfitobacter sp. D35]|uniref:helix-turn-helix domain-containing protein n=1 Tax=Sulfitobacter sp. D35 TaxID=3083252 RepID=UPI00296F038D|nr:short-chain fatty acyl-CoA regulator family protein [Sulfitobacter sp. D35]MDW4499174.1 short-chain fatty acyl-CoA regulator family protein [Sulfitobacter sp. D35]
MKTFIGPRLRRLRSEANETQAQMARTLGISTSYVNMLEKNERSVSVAVLLRLFDAYGVDWREIADEDDAATLTSLRAAFQDPLFSEHSPDLPQLRALMSHAPDIAQNFLQLHGAYRAATEKLLVLSNASESDLTILRASPEAVVHDFFRNNKNHFPELEAAALEFWNGQRVENDDQYAALKQRLEEHLGLKTRVVPVADMPGTLRELDEGRREVRLSEGLDHPNRVFQLVHIIGLLERRDVIQSILSRLKSDDPQGLNRCRVELANYFAAAVLMPYEGFLAEALKCKYDFAHLSLRFGVSFEQACHRATTLQREGAEGVPFFFLRIDKAGNVTKRFNSTGFQLAEYGGACPRLDLHTSFRSPGTIMPQLVEMPDGGRFFVFSRTVNRPRYTRHTQDKRLVVAMGCSIEHLQAIGYAEGIGKSDASVTKVGINCRICPRANCDQRAHNAMILNQPVDVRRRGATRYST